VRDATGVVYQSQASALAALAFVAAFVGSPVPAQGAAITSAALSGFGVQGGTQKSKTPKRLATKPRH